MEESILSSFSKAIRTVHSQSKRVVGGKKRDTDILPRLPQRLNFLLPAQRHFPFTSLPLPFRAVNELYHRKICSDVHQLLQHFLISGWNRPSLFFFVATNGQHSRSVAPDSGTKNGIQSEIYFILTQRLVMHNFNIGKCYQIVLYNTIVAFLKGFWLLSLILLKLMHL